MIKNPSAAEMEPRGRSGQRVGFWLIALAFLAAMAFSTLPTPLYPLYQERDGFSSFVITIVFAVYAIGVAVSLVLVGHISDWVGRRRVLLPSLALELLAAVVFLVWPELPGLIVARFLSGFGIGMLTATATAQLRDLHEMDRPGGDSGRFEIVSVSANIGGLGLGTLLAGALAQFAPRPLAAPFLLFIVLLLLAMLAVRVAPETVERSARRYRPQRITVTGRPAQYLVAAGSAFVSFAVFGLFSALVPVFLVATLHQPSRLLAGVVVFVIFTSAAAAQSVTSGLTGWAQLTCGLLAEMIGLVLVAVGSEVAGLLPFLIGGALAGAGAGLLFKSAVGTIAAAAPPSGRGEALASLFLIAYLGLIGPVLGMGVATLYIPSRMAMLWFAGILLLLLAGVGGIAVADGQGRSQRRAHRAA